MRLDCAIVSSFLFASAVLADFHREQQQPSFLNRAEKSIDQNTIIPFNRDEWAGAVWVSHSEKVTANFVAGTFTVPRAKGAFSSGFNIAVGMGGYTHGSIILGVGITVRVWRGSDVLYQAWAQWYPDDVKYAPAWFPIIPGHVIRVIVYAYTKTRGFLLFWNLVTDAKWWVWVSGAPWLRQLDAEWVVTTISETAPVDLPEFCPVTFTNITVGISGIPKVPDSSNIITSVIKQDKQVMTSVWVYRDFVVIVYNPMLQ